VGGIGDLSGVALECRDPAALATFYSALTGWPVVFESDDWCSIGPARDAPFHLSFQRAAGHRPPAWPDEAASMQAHLHVRVDDLDVAERAALDLGATRAAHQPDPERHRVFVDPAGHPFCVCRRPAR
jgi:catechol 2,3-dioxygenase-like lactoylglutathione lyase family enzyme